MPIYRPYKSESKFKKASRVLHLLYFLPYVRVFQIAVMEWGGESEILLGRIFYLGARGAVILMIRTFFKAKNSFL